MSDKDPTSTPTRWFLYHYRGRDGRSDEIVSAARWWWPDDTYTEVNKGDGWAFAPVFLDLHEDTGWETATEEEVEAFLAAKR